MSIFLNFQRGGGNISGKTTLDFSKAVPDPNTGELCVTQRVCIADPAALAKSLAPPPEPCPTMEPKLPEGCNCQVNSHKTNIEYCLQSNSLHKLYVW